MKRNFWYLDVVNSIDEGGLERPVRPETYLFTLRMWQAQAAEHQLEWRGQIRQVLTGETHYFRNWQELIRYLESMLEHA